MFTHAADAQREGLKDQDWMQLEAAQGKVSAELSIQTSMMQAPQATGLAATNGYC